LGYGESFGNGERDYKLGAASFPRIPWQNSRIRPDDITILAADYDSEWSIDLTLDVTRA
jgi:hypothetical protein